MSARWLLVIGLAAATALQGCGFRRHFIDKRWGKGTYIPAAVCAVVGAGGGIGVQELRRGQGESFAEVRQDGKLIGRVHKTGGDYEYWTGALVGAAAGAVVCGLAGHYFFDPEPEAPPPPPPPPPPPTPNPEALPSPSSKRLVLRGVNFDYDKSDIRPDSRPVLDEAGEVLATHPQVRISVEGHTDYMGSDAYNEKLSVRRAEAVFRYLVSRGVTPERLEVIGYGEAHPVADNETETGRAENRRVELHVVDQPETNGTAPAAVPAPTPSETPAEPAKNE